MKAFLEYGVANGEIIEVPNSYTFVAVNFLGGGIQQVVYKPTKERRRGMLVYREAEIEIPAERLQILERL